MLKIMFTSRDNDGLVQHLSGRINAKEAEGRSYSRLRDKARASAYAAGMREALECVDAAIRSTEAGCAVELRRSDDIMKEAKS